MTYYGDESVIKNHCLQVVVYTTGNGDQVLVMPTQVLRATHVNPKRLAATITNFDGFFAHRFENLPREKYYLVDFKIDPKDQIAKISKVDDYSAENSIMGLH